MNGTRQTDVKRTGSDRSGILRCVRTLGIDLAAQPVKTAVCSIDWTTKEVEIEQYPLADDELVERILGADRTGIDAPFGWPAAFIASITAHHAQEAWPSDPNVSPDDARRPLRFRVTDLQVHEEGSSPLSVSSDRIAVTAMRCADLQHRLALRGLAVDRAGMDGGVCEVYPAASLRAWNFTSTGYKGVKNREGLRRLAESLLSGCPSLQLSEHTRARCLSDDDCLDAVVCSLTARANALEATHGPTSEQMVAARREGWIHVPMVPLTMLFDE